MKTASPRRGRRAGATLVGMVLVTVLRAVHTSLLSRGVLTKKAAEAA